MNSLRKRFPIYAAILRLYPAPYRRRYGEEMLQVTADMIDAAPDGLAKLGIWSQLCLDVPLSLLSEQLAYAMGPLSKDTPRYVKLASVISSLFLLPFFIMLALNTVDQVVLGQNLYHSWFWQTPQLVIWVLKLPIAALVIAGVCYVTYVLSGLSKGGLSWWKRATDMQHTWPVLLPILAGLGILFLLFFHDSVHCWVHSPVYLVTHLSASWYCTQISG